MSQWSGLLNLGAFLASEVLDRYGRGGRESEAGMPARVPPAGDAMGREALARAEEMESRLNRLTLACLAMWSMLKESNRFSEEVLLERIRQIDLMDGQLDGKVSTKVKRCTRCNRVMSRRHGRCLYCGAQDLEQTAIDAVS